MVNAGGCAWALFGACSGCAQVAFGCAWVVHGVAPGPCLGCAWAALGLCPGCAWVAPGLGCAPPRASKPRLPDARFLCSGLRGFSVRPPMLPVCFSLPQKIPELRFAGSRFPVAGLQGPRLQAPGSKLELSRLQAPGSKPLGFKSQAPGPRLQGFWSPGPRASELRFFVFPPCSQAFHALAAKREVPRPQTPRLPGSRLSEPPSSNPPGSQAPWLQDPRLHAGS